MAGRRLRPTKRLAGIWIAALFAAGCSQLADYQRPEPPVPAAWPEPEQAMGRRPNQRVDWRSFFPDARLQALIATALDNNRDLRMAVGRVAEARAQHGVVSADRLPTANLVTSRAATGVPGELYGLSRQLTSQRYDFNTTVSYEVDFWGRVTGLSESAFATFMATEAAQRSARVSLISDVANAYFVLLELDERVVLGQATKDTRERTRELVAKAVERGLASKFELLQADGAVETARSELATLELQRANALNLLDFLTGGKPSSLPAGRGLDGQDVFGDIAVDLPSETLLARPDVIAAEQRLIAAHANIGAARAAFFPRILLTAGLGMASRTLAELFGAGANAWSFQPTLTLPLFDAGRTASNVDVAEARKNIAVADYEKTIQQAFREIADLLAARNAFATQRQANEANVKAQEERLNIAMARYKGGMISFLDVLDSQREYFSAQQAALQVKRVQLSVAAQLYKALGGE